MNPGHLVIAGLLLLLVPVAVALLSAVWLPLGALLVAVGLSLYLVQRHYLADLDEANPRRVRE